MDCWIQPEDKMQCSLVEPPDIRPPGDPECLEMRRRAIMSDRKTSGDVDAYLRRETVAMSGNAAVYWVCGSGVLRERLGGDCPDVLLVRGVPDLSVPRVAVVGPRRPDDYGVAMAAAFSSAFAASGIIVVSGGACGIDTIAHQSALAAGGRTACVLGSGFDRPHPPSNTDLFARLGANGGWPDSFLVSEHSPGRGANPGFFPRRNRLVAALADAVVVIQGDFDSGALITARAAIEIRVPLFVVPADIHWTRSAGSNGFLGRGAASLCRPSDILAVPAFAGVEFPGTWEKTVARPPGWGSPWSRRPARPVSATLSAGAIRMFDIVSARHDTTGTGADIEFLACESGCRTPMVQAVLLELELAGMIRRVPGGAAVPVTCRSQIRRAGGGA